MRLQPKPSFRNLCTPVAFIVGYRDGARGGRDARRLLAGGISRAHGVTRMADGPVRYLCGGYNRAFSLWMLSKRRHVLRSCNYRVLPHPLLFLHLLHPLLLRLLQLPSQPIRVHRLYLLHLHLDTPPFRRRLHLLESR